MQKIPHKKGDTFFPLVTFRDADGVATDYVALGVSVESQVRTPAGKLISQLTFGSTLDPTQFTLRGDSSTWPVGELYWDIQFLQGSDIFSTQTAILDVSPDVTR